MKKQKPLSKICPRPYISYSQLHTVESSPKSYIKTYLYGMKFTNDGIELGRKVDEALNNPDNEHPEIEIAHLQRFFPRYPEMQKELTAKFAGVPLLGRLDGFNQKERIIADNKAMEKYTQEMADKSDQLTFYTMLCVIKFKIPAEKWNLQINWAPTFWENEELKTTGAIHIFKTKRTTRDIIKMGARVVEVAEKINRIVEKEIKF